MDQSIKGFCWISEEIRALNQLVGWRVDLKITEIYGEEEEDEYELEEENAEKASMELASLMAKNIEWGVPYLKVEVEDGLGDDTKGSIV